MNNNFIGLSSRRNETQDVKPHPEMHVGLWLDRYPQSILRKNIDRINDGQEAPAVTTYKQVAAAQVSTLYGQYLYRWELLLNEIGARAEIAAANAPLVIGLGTESVLETSIILHHTYGVPYLPGSALKGLASSYAHLRLKDDAWRKGNSAHREMFGDTTRQGVVMFLDAVFFLPERQRNAVAPSPLRRDIMAVHHRKYYGGEKDAAPTDFDQPTPVSFVSVKPKTQFLVALAGDPIWVNSAWEILTKALEEFGIGAKTSSGYGRMTLAESKQP